MLASAGTVSLVVLITCRRHASNFEETQLRRWPLLPPCVSVLVLFVVHGAV